MLVYWCKVIDGVGWAVMDVMMEMCWLRSCLQLIGDDWVIGAWSFPWMKKA